MELNWACRKCFTVQSLSLYRHILSRIDYTLGSLCDECISPSFSELLFWWGLCPVPSPALPPKDGWNLKLFSIWWRLVAHRAISCCGTESSPGFMSKFFLWFACCIPRISVITIFQHRHLFYIAWIAQSDWLLSNLCLEVMIEHVVDAKPWKIKHSFERTCSGMGFLICIEMSSIHIFPSLAFFSIKLPSDGFCCCFVLKESSV